MLLQLCMHHRSDSAHFARRRRFCKLEEALVCALRFGISKRAHHRACDQLFIASDVAAHRQNADIDGAACRLRAEGYIHRSADCDEVI